MPFFVGNEIGNRIRRARQDKGLTQNELAEAMGTSMAVISRYESGKRVPSAKTIVAVASALDISPLSLAFVAPELRENFEKMDINLTRKIEQAEKQNDTELVASLREAKSAVDEAILSAIKSSLSAPSEDAIENAIIEAQDAPDREKEMREKRTSIRTEAKKRRQIEQLTSIFSELSSENRLKALDYVRLLKMSEEYRSLYATDDESPVEE